MGEYRRNVAVLRMKQAVVIVIMASVLFSLFSGCSTGRIPDNTERTSESSPQETTSAPDGTEKEEDASV